MATVKEIKWHDDQPESEQQKGERVNVNGAEKVLKKQPCNILLGAGLESGTSAYKRLVQNYKRWNIQEDPTRGGEGGWK